MQVSVENTHNLGRRITITIPAENIKNLVKIKLSQLAQKVRIDGFRQGKVPLEIVAKRYGMSILHEVLTDLMQQKVMTVINKNNLVPVGKLNYIPGEYKEGSDFTYVIEFEIYPEIKLKEFDSIQVKKPLVELNEIDVDNMLLELGRQQGVWKEVIRPVKVGDRVTIEITNLENDENESDKINQLIWIIGQESMFFDLEKKIIGHNPGDNFIVESIFTEGDEKPITNFYIQLKKIEECQIPEMNEQLIKNLGEPEGSIIKLRDEIRKTMEQELKHTVNNFIKLQVFHGLLSSNQVEVPISLLESELKNFSQQSSIKQQIKLFPRRLLEKKAKNRVSLGLLLNEVIRINKLQVEEQRLQQLIKSLEITSCKKFSNNDEIMKSIKNSVLEDMAVELIMKQCVITEQKMPFQDLRRMIVEYEQCFI
ncbi:MAG: trigger factor [Candidatus Dasytiphilus stammeri]